MKNSNGFSLLETIIIVAVIAILSSFAVPSLIGQKIDGNLKDAVSTIRGDFEMARSRAIRENAFVAVILAANNYTIFVDNGAGGGVQENWVQDGDERLLCSRSLPAGIQIDLANTTFSDQRTRFNGKGYNGNSGVLSVLASNGKTSTIDMNNRFGRITTH